MVVSEKHGLMIIAVDHELSVYRIDPVTLTFCNTKKLKKITLGNDEVSTIIIHMCAARNQQSQIDIMQRIRIRSDSGHGRLNENVLLARHRKRSV